MPQRWLDLIFGLTEGWWRFTDIDRRPAYPLLDRAKWRELLTATGFEEAIALPSETDHDGLFARQALLLARAPAAPIRPGNWLIFGDKGGVGSYLAEELRHLGEHTPLYRTSRILTSVLSSEMLSGSRELAITRHRRTSEVWMRTETRRQKSQ